MKIKTQKWNLFIKSSDKYDIWITRTSRIWPSKVDLHHWTEFFVVYDKVTQKKVLGTPQANLDVILYANPEQEVTNTESLQRTTNGVEEIHRQCELKIQANGSNTLLAPLDMKGCICHFVKWQIHPFTSIGTFYANSVKLTCKGSGLSRPSWLYLLLTQSKYSLSNLYFRCIIICKLILMRENKRSYLGKQIPGKSSKAK